MFFFSSGVQAISVFVLQMGVKQASPFRVNVKKLPIGAGSAKRACVPPLIHGMSVLQMGIKCAVMWVSA